MSKITCQCFSIKQKGKTLHLGKTDNAQGIIEKIIVAIADAIQQLEIFV